MFDLCPYFLHILIFQRALFLLSPQDTSGCGATGEGNYWEDGVNCV
jgi:hypothetical protein